MGLEVIGDISNGLHNLNDILTLSFVKQNIVYFIGGQGQRNTDFVIQKQRNARDCFNCLYLHVQSTRHVLFLLLKTKMSKSDNQGFLSCFSL